MDGKFWLATAMVVLVSLTMNWFIQLGYYFWRKHQNPKAFAGQRTLLNYYTGFLGDGVVVPLINVLIFYIIVSMGQREGIGMIGAIGGIKGVSLAFTVGLMVDILAHYLQGKLKLTNWSMPRPFHWNFAGYWHMISFSIQLGYLALFFWIIWTKWVMISSDSGLALAAIEILSLMVVFILLYAKDNRWI